MSKRHRDPFHGVFRMLLIAAATWVGLVMVANAARGLLGW